MNDFSQNENNFIVKFRGGTYDLTKFLKKHPGGINTLKGLNGNDMTKRFSHAPKHSNSALYLLNEYQINSTKHLGYENNSKYQNEEDKVNNNNNNNNIKIDKQLIDESMEHLVDWSKGMLIQISKLNGKYYEWVNKPVDRPLRLFNSWYLEIFTKTPWWIIPLFWMPIISFLIFNEIKSHNFSMQKENFILASYFIYGILIWTLVEYSLHRWVFHINTCNKNTWICTLHFLIHGLHHKVPFDSYRLVFPPLPGFILSLMFYPIIILISKYPQITMAGGLLGYLCYDMIHFYLHFGNPRIQHFYNMKRYHYQHHFGHHNLGFGISSSLWDYIFGTKIYLRKLKYILQWKH